ncbi:hypothetical protein [Actinokineospora sp. NPDC004072]
MGAAAPTGRMVNLVGGLGTGKTWAVRGLPADTYVDLSALRRLPQWTGSERLIVIDHVDSPATAKIARHLVDQTQADVLLVSRRPLRARPGWQDTGLAESRARPLADERIDQIALASGVTDPAARALVRTLAAGVPLLAVAACQALVAGTDPTPGPVADHIADVVLDRLGTELPGTRWRHALRLLACVRVGDEHLLRGGPDLFTAVSGLSLVRRTRLGLAVDEPYRAVLEAAYRWRRPAAHTSTRTRAAAYRLDQLRSTTDPAEAVELTDQSLFLTDEPVLRSTLYPPGRPDVPIRQAGPDDAEAILALSARWAASSDFDTRRCQRLTEQWLTDEITGFCVALDDDGGIAGMIRLADISDTTLPGIEPVLQQHTGKLIGGKRAGGLFLGAAYCPDRAIHAQLLRHILMRAVGTSQLIVSTANPTYQALLGALRFTAHGPTRDDVYRCGKPPGVYSTTQFTRGALPGWLVGLGKRDQGLTVNDVADLMGAFHDPAALMAHPAAALGAGAAELRELLRTAVSALADSPVRATAEAGRILHDYYIAGRRARHEVIAHRLHLSRATYFRRLRHGLTLLHELLTRG